jgi:hypothetical protein
MKKGGFLALLVLLDFKQSLYSKADTFIEGKNGR